MLLPYLKGVLNKRVHDIELRTWTVHFAQPTEVKQPQLEEIAEYANAVVALIGD